MYISENKLTVDHGYAVNKKIDQLMLTNPRDAFRGQSRSPKNLKKQKPKNLLPEHTNHPYHLRSRTHSFKLSFQHDERNFFYRMLFKNANPVCTQ